MATFELEYTKEDLAEIITIIRVQHLKLSQDAFGERLGVKGSTISLVEEGKSAHIESTFQKCIEHGFINVTKFTVEI